MATTATEIEIRELSDGEVLYAKGHLDKRAFAEAVCRYQYSAYGYDDPPTEADFERIAGMAVHEHWRMVPSGNWSEYRYMSMPAEPGSRGSFKATVVRL